ncbi:hypothetical protein M422DRAFT_247866 [Sphaerobolus stellatus SS14]|nr:hypothetical protein M422DRAFT_247866 [Sphaerobolus stellatus SS14]
MEKELAALKLEVERLRLASNKQEKVIQKQAVKLSTLKESIYGDEESDSDSDVSDSDSEGGQTSNGERPEPILDENDEVYRCSDCMFEVVEGECASSECGLKHRYVEEDEDALDLDRNNYVDCESDNEDIMYFAEDDSETEEEAHIQEAMADDPSLTHFDLLPPLFEANSDSDSDMVGSDWNSDGTLSGDEALKRKT